MSTEFRLERLTAEQNARMPEIAERWIGYGLSTAPADREAAEAAMRLAYERGGVPWHSRVTWCTSPLALALVDAILRSLPPKAGASVWASVRASVGASVWDSVGDSVRASVGDSVGDSVWDSVWASVRASVGDSVGASVWASVGDSVGASVWASVNSFWECCWLAFYAYFREVCGLTVCDRLDGLMALHQSSGWWIARQGRALISDRPNVLKRDARGRLHSEDGPAIAYPDGWRIYAWHGVVVPERVIEHPDCLTAAQIRDERNAEVRRVMLERFGTARYIREIGAHKLHSDDVGTLWRADLARDEPLVMVQVLNSTPEPDGSVKEFWLRVHPELRPLLADGTLGAPQARTARNAVASTFGKRGHEYAPAIET